MPAITKRRLETSIAGAARDAFLWDSEIPGFGVRIKAGAPTFLIQYRNGAGRSRRHSFARYGIMTCDEARREARRLLAEVARGIDVTEVKAAGRKAPTVASLCTDYLRAARAGEILTRSKKPKKRSTIATDAGRVERHITPLLGHRLVADVTSADIERFRLAVRSGKTAAVVVTGPRGRAVVTGGAGTATRTLGLLGGIFTFAKRLGLRADNPVTGVARDADGTRKVALATETYARLGAAIKDGGLAWQASAGLVLLAATGARRGEIEHLKAEEVHARSRALDLTDSKTGPNVRPVGAPVIDLLALLPVTAGSGFVLPAARGGTGSYGGLPRAWAAIRGRVPSLEGCTMRDLRRSFATVADELGLSIPTIAALLGHAGSSITMRYISRPDPAIQAAADLVAAEILRRMDLTRVDLLVLTRMTAP